MNVTRSFRDAVNSRCACALERTQDLRPLKPKLDTGAIIQSVFVSICLSDFNSRSWSLWKPFMDKIWLYIIYASMDLSSGGVSADTEVWVSLFFASDTLKWMRKIVQKINFSSLSLSLKSINTFFSFCYFSKWMHSGEVYSNKQVIERIIQGSKMPRSVYAPYSVQGSKLYD